MFKQLAPLLAGGNTLLISAALSATDATKLRLTITPHKPKAADGQPAVAADPAAPQLIDQPVVIEATADELDTELPGALTQHVEAVQGVRGTFALLQQRLQEEEAAANRRIEDARKKGTAAPATPAAPPAHRANTQPALF